MSAQANILSFEDITLHSNDSRRAQTRKRASLSSQRAAHASFQPARKSAVRASSSSRKSLQQSQRGTFQSKRNTRNTRQHAHFEAQSSARGKTRQSHRLAVTSSEHTADAISPRLSVRSSQNRSLQGFASGNVRGADAANSRRRSASASSRSVSAQRFQQTDMSAHQVSSRQQSDSVRKDKKTQASFAQELKKNSRKAKAEKKFNKSPYAQSASREQTSRAALYEMRMGRTQKKSSRMHNEQTRSGATRAGFSASGILGMVSRVFSSRVALAFVALAFTFAFLYQPLSSYYGETRHLQRLEVEYAALTEHNNALQSEIDYLNTDEGLEDYARYKLGLVKSNEHMVNVTNVSSSAKEHEADGFIYSMPSNYAETPDTWYSGVLDVVFNYQKQ